MRFEIEASNVGGQFRNIDHRIALLVLHKQAFDFDASEKSDVDRFNSYLHLQFTAEPIRCLFDKPGLY